MPSFFSFKLYFSSIAYEDINSFLYRYHLSYLFNLRKKKNYFLIDWRNTCCYSLSFGAWISRWGLHYWYVNLDSINISSFIAILELNFSIFLILIQWYFLSSDWEDIGRKCTKLPLFTWGAGWYWCSFTPKRLFLLNI